MLHFPIVFAAFGPRKPQKNPARFARRIASFPYCFAALDTQYPYFSPARFARRVASIPYSFFATFGSQIPWNFPRRASSAGLLHLPIVSASFGPRIPHKSRRASHAGLLHIPIVYVAFGAQIPQNPPARFARRVASFPYSICCFPRALRHSFWAPRDPIRPIWAVVGRETEKITSRAAARKSFNQPTAMTRGGLRNRIAPEPNRKPHLTSEKPHPSSEKLRPTSENSNFPLLLPRSRPEIL